MAGYSNVVTRGSTSDPLVPEPIVAQVVEQLPQSSVVLERARRVQLTSRTGTQPVLSALPEAYWVNGEPDPGEEGDPEDSLKQTTKPEWDKVTITAEELAAIVVIPDAYFDDASVPLWDQIRPLLTEAIGKKVDQAALFGVDKPSSWPTAVVPAAIGAGNVVAEGSGVDIAAEVATLAGLVAEDGYSVNGFASAPGLQWKLIGLRSGQGAPIYTPALAPGQPSGLYGYPLNEVTNGAWNSATATLLAADWSKFVVGVRQDITFRIFSEGVISDASGNVVVNLMQQDAKAMRVVFRVGFQVARPVTRIGGATRYPAGVLVPTISS